MRAAASLLACIVTLAPVALHGQVFEPVPGRLEVRVDGPRAVALERIGAAFAAEGLRVATVAAEDAAVLSEPVTLKAADGSDVPLVYVYRARVVVRGEVSRVRLELVRQPDTRREIAGNPANTTTGSEREALVTGDWARTRPLWQRLERIAEHVDAADTVTPAATRLTR